MSVDRKTDLPFTDNSQLTAAEFEPYLNTEFAVDLKYCGIAIDGTPLKRSNVDATVGSLKLVLREVTRKQRFSRHSRETPFVLLFCGSHDRPLTCDMHVLEHDSLGRILLMLSPVNADPGILPEKHPEGRFYEVVFG